MGEHEPDEDGKRKRAEALIGDFINEREELREGPRFHVPPFVERRIDGTRTVFYMPVDAEDLEAPANLPAAARPAPPELTRPAQAEVARPAPAVVPRPVPADAVKVVTTEPSGPVVIPPPAEAGGVSRSSPPPIPFRAEARSVPANFVKAAPGPAKTEAPSTTPLPEPAVTEKAPPLPPAPAAPPVTAPFEFPAKLTFEPQKPVSFRKPFVKPDTTGARRPSMQPLQRRPSAKDLIARLRVVKESVETREQVLQRMADAAATPEPFGAEENAPATQEGPQEASDTRPAAPSGAADEAGREAVLASAPAPAPQLELRQKTEGGKLCPSCGSAINDRNRLLICTSCGKVNCDACGRYELSHLKTDIYYEYQFDFPLCLQCYGNAFSIQRLLGRAGVCYGNGNYSYALYYANQAMEQDPESKYAHKVRDLIAKINKAHEAAHERDKEWRLQRKQFVSRNRVEDPSWR